MRRTFNIFILALTSILFLYSCSDDKGTGIVDEESTPVINSIASDKSEIMYGGVESAILTCNASGGNLSYVWQVDLGDLVPLNKDRSSVSFTGSACCVGEKIISCTVSNSKGSVTAIVKVKILENMTVPEIITIESDKTELNASAGESALLACYAIGGNLKYQWSADCGDILINQADNSKINYKPNSACVGTRTISCLVSNDLGEVWQTYQIEVK